MIRIGEKLFKEKMTKNFPTEKKCRSQIAEVQEARVMLNKRFIPRGAYVAQSLSLGHRS